MGNSEICFGIVDRRLMILDLWKSLSAVVAKGYYGEVGSLRCFDANCCAKTERFLKSES